MAEFGNRLRDLRIAHNMSQDEVAAAINVTRQAISKWETDHGLPDVASLGTLARLFNTTVDYLLTGEEKVRIEKEVEIVEREKVVERERPLSYDEKERLLFKFRDVKARLYCLIGISIFTIVMGLPIMILYSPVGLVFLAFIITSITCTLINWRIYKREKEKMQKYLDEESKLGKLWRNKNEKNKKQD
ncbi:MAG: helix-turn-helix domain-containing protein [Clostridiales bacterium]|nr:helix-turn-helix domain-containing protein [Clostridiales bacterium]